MPFGTCKAKHFPLSFIRLLLLVKTATSARCLDSIVYPVEQNCFLEKMRERENMQICCLAISVLCL